MNEKDLDIIIDNILSIKLIFFKALVNTKGLKTLISPAIYYLMISLEKHGSLSMSNIGKEIYTPKPNVTTLIDKLILNKLVERFPDAKDRRIINIKLTKKGLKTKQDIDNIFRQKTRKRLSSLTENEAKELSHSLSIVRKILSKIQKDA
jgi:DNA-binding MarR family transcriptional regulator